MNTRCLHFLFVLVVTLFTPGIIRAEDSVLLQRQVSKLSYAEGKPVFAFFFELNGKRYDSVDALKSGILSLERGTVILFRPGCRRFGGEPLDSPSEYNELGTYCEVHGIILHVARSGGSRIYPEEKKN